MRITSIRLQARTARHARRPSNRQRRRTPSCEACGHARVKEVQGDVLRSHQPRWQP